MYVDMIIHVSAIDLQRNLDSYTVSTDGPLDRFAPGWRDVVNLKQSQSAVRAAFVRYGCRRWRRLGCLRGVRSWWSGKGTKGSIGWFS
jgi:hypothetical protein